MPVFLGLIINILVFFLTSTTSTHASCPPSLFFRPNLVIAKFESEGIVCENKPLSILTFSKIFSIKGNFNTRFLVSIPTRPSYCPNINPQTISSTCPQCLPYNQLIVSDYYLLSLDSPSQSIYFEPSKCDQIFTQSASIINIAFFFQLIRIITQPVWTSILIIALLISTQLDNFFPTVIAVALSFVILVQLAIILPYLIYRKLRS